MSSGAQGRDAVTRQRGAWSFEPFATELELDEIEAMQAELVGLRAELAAARAELAAARRDAEEQNVRRTEAEEVAADLRRVHHVLCHVCREWAPEDRAEMVREPSLTRSAQWLCQACAAERGYPHVTGRSPDGGRR